MKNNTTKKFKKCLSLFLAVLMVLTSWVWVEPAYVEASGSKNASEVSKDNLALLNTLPTSVDSTLTTVLGKFKTDDQEGDDNGTYNTANYGGQHYKNILYSPTVDINGYAVYMGSDVIPNIDSVRVYYPDTVMMYDGSTKPQMGAVVCLDASKGNYIRALGVYISANDNGIVITDHWKGQTTGNLAHLINIENGSYKFSKDSTEHSSYKINTGSTGEWYFYASDLRFDGTMSDTEFLRKITPTWGFHGARSYKSWGSWKYDSIKKFTKAASKTIYVINVKAYRDKINEALSTVAAVKAAPAQYTTASVEAFVKAVKALIDANPKNYNIGSTGGAGAQNWDTAVREAVSQYDTALSNAKLAKYTLTFEDNDGNQYSKDYDYGTSVNLNTLAANYANTVEIDDNVHKLYAWDIANATVTVTDDITINEKLDKTEPHDTTGTYSQGDDTHHSKVCPVCGYVIKTEHAWGNGVIDAQPTCTDPGSKTVTCTECGKTKTEVIPANGHSFGGAFVIKENGENGTHYQKCANCGAYGYDGVENAGAPHEWDNGVVVKEPTCTETGIKKHTCIYGCGATYNEVTDPKGHNFTGPIVPNVKGEDGNHWRKCSRCDVFGWGTAEGGCENHRWNSGVVTTDPTCTKEGIKTFTCESCNDTYTESVAKIPHAYDSGVVTPPTCTAEGYTTYTCTACDHSYKDNETDMIPHKYVGEVTKEATCTQNGTKTYTCSACGDSYTEVILANGNHNYVPVVTKEPTCTKEGTMTYKCGCTEILKTEPIPALQHDFTGEYVCAEEGKDGKHYRKCVRFDECNTYSEATAHNWNDGVVTIKETCTVAGEMTYTCKECKTTYTEAIAPTGHDFTGAISNDGNKIDGTHSYECKNGCGKYGYVDAEGNDIVGGQAHDWNDGRVTKNPDCIEDGTKVFLCKTEGCSGTYTEVLPKLGHRNVTETPALDKSNYCGEQGHRAFWTCADCGRIYKDAEFENEISNYEFTEVNFIDVPTELLDAKTQHEFIDDYASVVSGKDGTHAKKCIRYEFCKTCDEATAEPHVWGKPVRTEPTHYKDGAFTSTCTVCKDTYSEIIPKDENHNYKSVVTAPTCTTDGFTTYTCDCGDFYIDDLVDPTGHDNEVTITKTPTCTEDGEKSVRCKVCGVEEVVEIVANGHKFGEKIAAVAATCKDGGAKGNLAYKQCNICSLYFAGDAGVRETDGKLSAKDFDIPALDHTFITGEKDVQEPLTDTLVSKATCLAAAVYKVKCDRCRVDAADVTYTYGDPIDHNFAGDKKANGNKTHSFACTYDCGTYGNAEACVYDKVSKYDETNHKVSCECGDYELKTHTFGEWTDVDGTNTRKRACTVCDYVETTTCEFDEGVVTKEATCTEDGVMTFRCNHDGCDKFYTEVIPKLGHTWVQKEEAALVATEATCEADATYYEVCDVCSVKSDVTWIKEGSKLTHAWGEWVQTVDENGVASHTRTCSHNSTAGCTETALCSGGTANCTDKAVCSVCNNAYGDIDSDNHKDAVTVKAVDATCQTEGYEAYRYCNACKKALEEIRKIEKYDHVYGKWTKVDGEDKHARSCTTCDATVGEVATEKVDCSGGIAYCNTLAKCSVCKAQYGTVNPANHKTEANTLKDVVAATCTSEGFSGNYRYDCCNEIKETGKTIEKLKHIYLVEVEGTRKAATCLAKGEVVYKCKTCDDTSKTILPVDPKNHATPDKTVVKGKVDATCEADGYTGDVYYECCYDKDATEAENRKALKEKGSVIEASGEHTYSAAVAEYLIEKIEETKDDKGNVTKREIVLKTTEPTYEEKVAARHADGKWYHTSICTVCYQVKNTACTTFEHTYNCVDTDICSECGGICSLKDAAKHKGELTVVPGKAATCVATGVKEYYTCEYCEVDYLDKAGKTALDKTDKDADGVYDVLVIAKTAHDVDWDKGYVKPEEPEYTYYKCKNCDYEEKVENGYDGSCEHVWSEDYKVVDEADCTNHGYEALYCTLCDEIKAGSYKQISALGHDWDEGKVTEAATCTEEGVVTYTCTRKECGETKTETTDALGHSWDDGVVTKEANCKDKGEILYTCTVCYETKTEETPKNGTHIISGEGIVIKEPTCNTNGSVQYVCGGCNNSFIDVIPATGEHRPVTIPGKEPTCSANGYGESTVCGDCGFVIAEGAEIPADPSLHHDHNGDGYCDDCTYDLMEGKCDCVCHKQNGLMKFIYKILRFFWKLFGISKTCRCGIEHY